MNRHPQAGADARPKPTRAPVWIHTDEGLINLHHIAKINLSYRVDHREQANFYAPSGACIGRRILRDGETIESLIAARTEPAGAR